MVLKAPVTLDDTSQIDREEEIYIRLGRHPGILTFYGRLSPYLLLSTASLRSIRQYFQSLRPAWTIDLSTKLRWIQEVVESLAFIHSKQVFHGDVSANNIFLDGDLCARLADFGSAAIDDKEPLGLYKTSHSLPSYDSATRTTDLFALDSTMYELLTGQKPYYDMEASEIDRKFETGKFPVLTSLPACQKSFTSAGTRVTLPCVNWLWMFHQKVLLIEVYLAHFR